MWSMLNEARAFGGAVVGLGILIILGAFSAAMTFTSSILSFVVFLSFGFARLLGIALDGMPGEEIIQGVIFEFVFGVVGATCLPKISEKNSHVVIL